MYFTRNLVGRFVEVRISSPFELPDLKLHVEAARRVLAAARQEKLIFCVDIRGATVFTQEVAAGLLELMRSDTPRIERSGFLLADGAVFTMQVERMVRMAAHPSRRTFREANQCVAWLSEVLIAEERRELQRFVNSSGVWKIRE
jgi:hypothetical protein